MNENTIIDINEKLPRGLKVRFAKKYKLSHTSIKLIARGILDRPKIYKALILEIKKADRIKAKKATERAELIQLAEKL